MLSGEGRARSALPSESKDTVPVVVSRKLERSFLHNSRRITKENTPTSRERRSDARVLRLHIYLGFAEANTSLGMTDSLDYEAHAYTFAFLCMSTVLQVLSPAWHRFSSGQSAHLGLRAGQRLRPCQMI